MSARRYPVSQLIIFLAVLLLMTASSVALAQEEHSSGEDEAQSVQQFGGPGSVPGQLAEDRRLRDSLSGVDIPRSWADWKKALKEERGLDFTVDYNVAGLHATNIINDDDNFAGGVLRFFGQWDFVNRDSGNTGSFIWKIENRHGYTDIAPNGAKTEIGYIGLFSPTFSDIGARFADSNADSTHPFDGFDTFFNDHEFLKTIEFGHVTSRDRFFLDNTHITFWHADERKEAGVNSGWGVSFSYSHSFDEKWMPFLRGGYANDGGTLLQKSLSTGLAYHWGDNNSMFGLGFNWSQPNEDTFGPGLKNQTAVEMFSRFQIMENFQITPDAQYIRNPALNTDYNHSWVLTLRARLYF